MTPADVVWSLNRHVDPKSGSQLSTWFAAMKQAVATGPYQVTVHLKRPDPVWIYMPASTAYIIEKAYALAKGKDLGTPSGGMMGTGAYRITDYKPDESLTLERNDSYWGEKPAIKKIELKFIPEDSTRLLALRSGQIDGTFILPLGESKSWEALHGVTVAYAPGMNQDEFGFDMTMKPWTTSTSAAPSPTRSTAQGLVKSLLQGPRRGRRRAGRPRPVADAAGPREGARLLPQDRRLPVDLAKAKEELRSRPTRTDSAPRSSTRTDSRRPARSRRACPRTWRRSASS